MTKANNIPQAVVNELSSYIDVFGNLIQFAISLDDGDYYCFVFPFDEDNGLPIFVRYSNGKAVEMPDFVVPKLLFIL